MGFTGAIIAGAVVGAGASAIVAKQNKPNIPSAPDKPDTLSADKMDRMAADREERARKKAIGAYGRSDTILTGPNGVSDENMLGTQQQTAERAIGKTLLGQ